MNRFAPISIGTLALVLALAGCNGGGGGGTSPDAGMGTPDAHMDMTDGGGADGNALSCTYPETGYGTTVGYKFAPFSLPQCDGTNYDFLNEDFCSSTLTVVSIAAGWCVPCQMESAAMTAQITEPYAPMGVRVIQVLVQAPDGSAPTESFCNSWVSTYGLTNIELMDATGVTQRYFPDNSLPSTIIVDSDGVIRFRHNGISSDPSDPLAPLRAKLDMLLAGG